MKVSISVSGIKEEMARIKREVQAKKDAKLIPVGLALKAALEDATPVDTGKAKAGWDMEIQAGKVVLTNDVPYIDALNKGHSKQAPSFFIEKTVLENKDVVPDGAIVTYR